MRKPSLVLSILLYAAAALFVVGIVANLINESEHNSLPVAILLTPYFIRLIVFEGAALLLLLATLLLMRSGRDIPFPSRRARKGILIGFAVFIPVWTAFLFYDYFFLSPQERAYQVAIDRLATIERRGAAIWLPEAAKQLDALGDYKDAREKRDYCWYHSGQYLSRFEYLKSDISNQSRTNAVKGLEDAKTSFTRANGYGDAPARVKELGERIDFLTRKNALRLELDREIRNGNFAGALGLLEHFRGDNDWAKLDASVSRGAAELRKKEELAAREEKERLEKLGRHEEQIARLAAFLQTVPGAAYGVSANRSIEENIDALIHGDKVFQADPLLVARLLVRTGQFGAVADLVKWNNTYPKGPAPWLSLTNDELLATILLIYEENQQADAGREVVEQFLPRAEASLGKDDYYDRCAALLLLYEPGPEWIGRCYPDVPRLKRYAVPGTLENRLVNAPAAVKNAFLDRNLEYVGAKRFTRTYSLREAETLFANFTPTRPFAGGYIYIAEHRNKPSGVELREPSGRDFEYESEHVLADIARDGWTRTLRTYNHDGSDWGPSFVCVSNPNNARLAIYEIHDYDYIGKYTIEKSDTIVDVYLPKITIRVVDLLTKKTLIEEEKTFPKETRYALDRKWVWSNNVYCPVLFYDRGKFLVDNVGLLGPEIDVRRQKLPVK